MNFLDLFLNNILTFPIMAFCAGIAFSFFYSKSFFPKKVASFLTFFILFCIGLKGGLSFVEHAKLQALYLLILLIAWGLVHPFLSYGILRRFTRVDPMTAIAISACFGSVSIMTYIAAANFLENLHIPYDGFVIAALAVMEVPAIISGLLISKVLNRKEKTSIKKISLEIFLNKTLLVLGAGMIAGALCSLFQFMAFTNAILATFKPCLSLFLFYLGSLVSSHREQLRHFSWSLGLFGIYMPIISGVLGILLSYFLGLSVGTGTLIGVLMGSASYIAVPAAMRIALPEAKEAVYLPLSLGIAFPFNIVIGIPLYYQIALKLLAN